MKKNILRALKARAKLQARAQGEDPAEETGLARVRQTGQLIGRRWRRRYRQMKRAFRALPAPDRSRMAAQIRREVAAEETASMSGCPISAHNVPMTETTKGNP